MITQQQEPSSYRFSGAEPNESALPRFAGPPNKSFPIEQEENGANNLTAWAWPVATWIVILFNTLIAFISVRDMFSNVYSPYTHYFMTFAFCCTIGMLAFIHRYILWSNKQSGPND